MAHYNTFESVCPRAQGCTTCTAAGDNNEVKGKQFWLLAAIAVAMALFLAACGGDEPTATPIAIPTPLPTSTPDAGALFQAEWDALIEAAQQDGELSLTFGGGAGRNYRPIALFFGEKFGIEVVVATGSGSAHVNRVLAEQAAGRYLVDVMYGGPTSVATRMVPANALIPVADLFIHPEVTDKSLWFGGKHYYSDPPQQFNFAFAASADPTSVTMHYNTDLVTQEEIDDINSVFDFLDPKWKGKIVAHVPGGGGGGSYYTPYVHPDIGPAWLDAFVAPELDVTFIDDNRLIVDGIAKGKYHFGIAIAGAGGALDALATLGAPVKKLRKEFKEGGTMEANTSTHNVSVTINQPHPNAAKLWVNWWLSQEGQTLMHTMSEEEADPTLRVDVNDWGKTTEDERRVEGKSYYFFGADPEYVGRRQEAVDYAAAAYAATH